MRKKFDLFNAVFITSLIIIFMILFLVGSKETISENENRTLQNMPKFSFESLFDGNYITKLESYFNDQFAFRENFISLKTKVLRSTLKDEINGVYYGKDDYLIESYNGIGNSAEIIKNLNDFYKKINYVNLNIILSPTSYEINKNKLPSLLDTDSQVADIKKIYDKLTFNKIEISNILNESEYQTFYKTDHHWTTYGAYFAYQRYCSMNNIIPISIRDFDIKKVTDSFCGTLCSKTGDFNHTYDSIYTFTYKNYDLDVNYVSKNVITKTLYESKYLEKKDKYAMFLDNNHPLIIITNNDIIEKKEIVVIKDSYANAFIPFLVNHFKKVHVIDPRYYKASISEYIKSNKNIKDALLIYNANTVDEDSGILSID